jgi:hypothetical protein
MEKAKRARKAETPKQPSLCLRLRAPYLYPDRVYSAIADSCTAAKHRYSVYCLVARLSPWTTVCKSHANCVTNLCRSRPASQLRLTVFPSQLCSRVRETMTLVELMTDGVASIIAGAVSALAGGGTLITFPVLLAVGVPSVPANVTNTVALLRDIWEERLPS